MIEEYLPGEASWDGRQDCCMIRSEPNISSANADLCRFTLLAAARFIDNSSSGRKRPVSFRFGIREDSADFIKLDVSGTMIVVGARPIGEPIERLLQAAVRARQMALMGNDGPFMFVPIVVFGESEDFLFYIESPEEVPPSSWMVSAAIEFVAKRMGPAYAQAADFDFRGYLQQMAAVGEDPRDLFGYQPLLRNILESTPAELVGETRRQIAAEIKSRI